MQLGITSTAGQVAKRLEKLARSDLPYVTALALNDTARDAHEELIEHIGEVFDNPTRFTRNAFYIWYANKRTLKAEVRRKTLASRRHYLEVQAEGGTRPSTGVETLLRYNLKYAGIVRTVTPTGRAKKDRHGNWSRGQRNQVLSAVQAQRDKSTNTTAASAARKKGRAGYFVPRPESKLSPGVYRRERSGDVTKILNFSDRPARYARRLDPQGVGEAVVSRRYADHFRKRLTEVLRG